MFRVYIPRKAVDGLLVLCLLAVTVLTPGSASAQPVVYTYANGIKLAAGTSLPIYHVITPAIDKASTSNLAQAFDGVYDRLIDPQTDMYRGHSRFNILNQNNNTILEQFGATGGFYAYNPTRAFGNTNPPTVALDGTQAQKLACQFMDANPTLITQSNDLTIPGLLIKCDHDFAADPLYKVSFETLSGQSNAAGLTASPTTNTILRVMVTAPILLNVGLHSQVPTIPLGGPGGHISMIFDDTSPNSTGPSLDGSVVGLQALAMPAFGRTFTFDKLLPTMLPADAKAQVLAQVILTYPTGKNITIPDPALEYYLTDAGTPQQMIEPDLVFSGISLEVDGQTLVLKDLTMPAVESGPSGAGPTVAITSPANGTFYLPGMPVSLQGTINDGAAPYQYEWQLEDGTPVSSGTAVSAGNLPLFTTTLPTPESKGLPGSQSVHLVVTDNNGLGITREAVISFVSPNFIYLPSLLLGAATVATLAPAAPALNGGAKLLSINYRFGVEYGSDYPPYGPGGNDLGGVPPDANGLSSSLFGLGWPRVFNWYNSMAWERDWRDCTLGGSDCTYGVDRADFVYYSGHGSNGGIAVPSNTHDSNWFDGANARFQNARWVGFSSCLTLRAQWAVPGAEPIRRWFNSFQGVHMLLGFNSLMADVAYGPPLVDNMRMPSFFGIDFPWAQRTIAEAWVQTAFEMNAGKPAYIWATSASVDPVGNKLPKVTDAPLPRPYPANWFYWVWWNE
jgi:hypothetical protein